MIVEIGIVMEEIGIKREIRKRNVRNKIVRKIMYIDIDEIFGRELIKILNDMGVGERSKEWEEGFGEGD